jgi:teichuronic acid biosynthesis glycosyltransferase TuaC
MKILIATAIYPTHDRPAIGTFVHTQVDSLRKAGVDVEVLVLNGRPRKLIYPKGIFGLRRRLRDSGIQLVHAHYSYVGMVARTQWKIPVVVTYHGSDILGEISASGCVNWHGRLSAYAGHLLSRYVDAAIVQTDEMANKIKGARYVYVIPCEVDLDLFRPQSRDTARAALNLKPDKKYLLFAANPDIPVKRFLLARAVADRLRQQDPLFELLVVYQEPQARLALYMNACDALILSSYQEGSPNVVKQAMACNLPVVATDVGDVRDLIGNTEGCYICKPQVGDFAGCLSRILRYRRRTEGRERVRNLDRSVVAEKLISVYEETLRRRTAVGNASYVVTETVMRRK